MSREQLGTSLITGGPFLLNVVLLPVSQNFMDSSCAHRHGDLLGDFRHTQSAAKEMQARTCRAWFAGLGERFFRTFAKRSPTF